MRFATLSLSLLLPVLSVFNAAAATIQVNTAGYHEYQQTTNSPCVIGESSCKNPSGFPYTSGTTVPGNVGMYTLTSPTYTVGQIETLLGSNSFFVGLDVNQNVNPQTLQAFTITIGGALTYSLPQPVSVPAISNGNGFADYYLSTSNQQAFSLSGLSSGTSVVFGTTVNPANAGGEQFFLLKGPGNVATPEPAAMALCSSGLLGLVVLARRRQRA